MPSFTAGRCAAVAVAFFVPLACAHGVELEGDITSAGAAGDPITGAGGGSTTGSDMGGAAGNTTGSGRDDGPTGGGGGAMGGAAGNASTTTGAAGIAGSTGGRASTGGAAGTGLGTGGTSGAGGSNATTGTAGKAGSAGTGGTTAGAGGSTGGAGGSTPRPTAVKMDVTITPTKQQAPSSDGNDFIQTCAKDEVIIGLTGTVNDPTVNMNYLHTFQTICGALTITGAGTYTVRTIQAETLPQPGMAAQGTMMQTRLCAADQMVVGFSGKSGALIDQISLICAPLVIGGTSPNLTLSVGTPTLPLLGLGGPGGGAFTAIDCPTNQVAVGNAGRVADFVSRYGLLCSTPTLVLQ
jgi:hypothetical protein